MSKMIIGGITMSKTIIGRFDLDPYQFLSNFYISPCEYEGIVYNNSECAFQAAKSTSLDVRKEFIDMKPGKAKRYGRKIELRDDVIWDDVKDGIMLEVVRSKFNMNKDLADKLLSTGDAEIIEGNNWGDVYWGQVDGVGDNVLGKILMQVRDEHKKQKKKTCGNCKYSTKDNEIAGYCEYCEKGNCVLCQMRGDGEVCEDYERKAGEEDNVNN